MEKRFYALRKFKEAGYRYKNIFFTTMNSQTAANIKKLIDTEKYKDIFEGTTLNFMVANCDLNVFETGLKMLQESLSAKYVIIADPIMISKIESIASGVLTQHECLGALSCPIKDWNLDMNLFDYPASIENKNDAIIAWTASAWNFIARELFAKAKALDSSFLNFIKS